MEVLVVSHRRVTSLANRAEQRAKEKEKRRKRKAEGTKQ